MFDLANTSTESCYSYSSFTSFLGKSFQAFSFQQSKEESFLAKTEKQVILQRFYPSSSSGHIPTLLSMETGETFLHFELQNITEFCLCLDLQLEEN